MKTLDLFLLDHIFDPLANWFFEKKGWSIFRLAFFFGILVLIFNLLKCLFIHCGILTPYDFFELISNLITIIIIIWYAKRKITILAKKGGKNPLREKWAYSRYVLVILTFTSILIEFFKDQKWNAYVLSCFYVLSFIPLFYVLCANSEKNEDLNLGNLATAV